MLIKESSIRRTSKANVIRLAKWLGLDIERDFEDIVKEMRDKDFIASHHFVKWAPKYFRGRVE